MHAIEVSTPNPYSVHLLALMYVSMGVCLRESTFYWVGGGICLVCVFGGLKYQILSCKTRRGTRHAERTVIMKIIVFEK